MAREVLVTAASGFVGVRLVRELLDRGERVRAFVNSTSDLSVFAGLDFSRLRLVSGDLRLEGALFSAMRGTSCVYHLAGSDVAERDLRGRRGENGHLGTRNVLRFAEQLGVEKVVISKSILTLVAERSSEVRTEEGVFDRGEYPTSAAPEDASELELVRDFAQKSSLPITIALPGLVVGAGDKIPTRTGRLVIDYLRASPSFPIPILEAGLNFVALDDVTKGLVLAMERGRSGTSYFLGGENLSSRSFYGLLFEAAGLAVPGLGVGLWTKSVLEFVRENFSSHPRRPSERGLFEDYFERYVFVTHEKASRELGYRPTSVLDALIESVTWFAASGLLSSHEARRIRPAPLRSRTRMNGALDSALARGRPWP